MTKARRRWRHLLPVICLTLLLLAGCDEKKQSAAPPASPAVGVRPATLKGVSQSFEFVGRIKAVDKVDLRARVEGFLEKIAFHEGQDVKAGDLLYQIEKVQFEAQVQQARANLASAEADATNAQLQYSRQLELLKHQNSPQSVVDQNKASMDSARAKVLQMQAVLTQAQVNLGYTDVRAPINGRIGRTAYTLGNLVNPASGVLATIVSQDPMYVLFPVSVRDLEIIREARQKEGGGLVKIDIRIRLSDGREYKQRGVWNLTDPQVDQQTDTLIMRATIPNPDRQLIDGQFVTAEIRERRRNRGWWCHRLRCNRPVRLLRAGGRWSAQSRTAPHPDRSQPRHGYRDHLRGQRRRQGDCRWHSESAARSSRRGDGASHRRRVT